MTAKYPGHVPTHHVGRLLAGIQDIATATHYIVDGIADESADLSNQARVLEKRATEAIKILRTDNDNRIAEAIQILHGNGYEVPF